MKLNHWISLVWVFWAGVSFAEEGKTVITSGTLEMQGTEDRNHFYFKGGVEVIGAELTIICDELVVIAFRDGDAGAAVGEIGAIESILAEGHVVIEQAGRKATAGRAEVNPVKGTVTLSKHPKIIDNDVEVEGYQFVIHTADKRVETIADPNASPDQPSRSKVTLSGIKQMDFSQSVDSITVGEKIKETSDAEIDPNTEVEVEVPEVTPEAVAE